MSFSWSSAGIHFATVSASNSAIRVSRPATFNLDNEFCDARLHREREYGHLAASLPASLASSRYLPECLAVASLKCRMSVCQGFIGNRRRGFGEIACPTAGVTEPFIKPVEERNFAHIARVFGKRSEHLLPCLCPCLFQCLAVLPGFIRKLRFEGQHPIGFVLNSPSRCVQTSLEPHECELRGRVRLVTDVEIETDLFLDAPFWKALKAEI